MARRHTPVVVLLTVEDFAVLEASAAEHDHDPYLHAHWLLAQRLGLPMRTDPTRSDDDDPSDLTRRASAAQ